MKAIGIDVGGANLKVADALEQAISVPFPMWNESHLLKKRLKELLSQFEPFDLLALTMTGELADCFQSKAEGVDFILTVVETVANRLPVVVWQTGAEFVSPAVAREIPLLVAAANWHGLATWLGRLVPKGDALLIDIGSTTTDIIPLLNGVPVPSGLTDRERLQSSELVYTGIGRTPLSAVVQSVPLTNADCRVPAEFFATTSDIYLLLDDIPQDPNNTNTANGRPATKPNAHDRIARICCCDKTEISYDEAIQIAQHITQTQQQQISTAIDQVLANMDAPCQKVIISGSGIFLAQRIIKNHSQLAECPMVLVSELFAPNIAQSAPAHALAQLAEERIAMVEHQPEAQARDKR